MIPISKNYIDSVCEIKTIENQLLSTGILQEVTDEYIGLVPKVGRLKLSRFMTPVKVSVYNSKLGFCVLVGDVYTSSPKYMKIINLSTLVEYERRHFFRVDTSLDAELVIRSGSDNEETLPVKIKNVSLSGCRFDVEKELDFHLIYHLNLKIGHRNCSFRCQLIRSYPTKENEPMEYGCAFLDNSGPDTDALCAFIFQLQREYLKSQIKD